MLINSSGQVFGRYNVIDFLGVLLALAVALGILAVQAGWHRTSGQVVKGEGDIEYTVFIRNLKTMQPDLFEPGKMLAMTIRNQPRGAVKIVKVERTPRKVALAAPGGVQTVEDPTEPHGFDYFVTLRDHALFTEEGYVTEGIKVKIGLPIEVEGRIYRVPGVIVAVREVSGKP